MAKRYMRRQQVKPPKDYLGNKTAKISSEHKHKDILEGIWLSSCQK